MSRSSPCTRRMRCISEVRPSRKLSSRAEEFVRKLCAKSTSLTRTAAPSASVNGEEGGIGVLGQDPTMMVGGRTARQG